MPSITSLGQPLACFICPIGGTLPAKITFPCEDPMLLSYTALALNVTNSLMEFYISLDSIFLVGFILVNL